MTRNGCSPMNRMNKFLLGLLAISGLVASLKTAHQLEAVVKSHHLMLLLTVCVLAFAAQFAVIPKSGHAIGSPQLKRGLIAYFALSIVASIVVDAVFANRLLEVCVIGTAVAAFFTAAWFRSRRRKCAN